MSETAVASRGDKVNEYVVRDALNLVLSHIVLATDELYEDVNAEDMPSAISTSIWAELWPNDEDVESLEYEIAAARAVTLAAAVLARLTSEEVRESLLAEAVRLGAHTSTRLGEKAQVGPPDSAEGRRDRG